MADGITGGTLRYVTAIGLAFTIRIFVTIADIVSLPVLQQADPEVLSDRGFDRIVRWVLAASP